MDDRAEGSPLRVLRLCTGHLCDPKKWRHSLYQGGATLPKGGAPCLRSADLASCIGHFLMGVRSVRSLAIWTERSMIGGWSASWKTSGN
jgi:hypothetical protein